MNVLVFDDRGSSSHYLIEWLKNQGHIVYEAMNPNDAQSIWNNRNVYSIQCIILDLNVPTDGLREEQKMRSAGGLIAGWIWLKENVLCDEPQMINRTIIYSDYIHVLKEHITKEDIELVSLIPKRTKSSSAEDVINKIREINILK